jgi:adenylate kinase family enzyme
LPPRHRPSTRPSLASAPLRPSSRAQLGVASAALFFDVSEETLEARLLERGKTSGRSDDNKESIIKRFRTFQLQSLPVVEYLGSITTVHKISGESPKDEVFAKVCAALGHDVPPPAGAPAGLTSS